VSRVARRRPPTATELHRQWLELVDTDGPFLSIPTLKRVWPQGIPPIDDDAKAAMTLAKPAFEQAWEAWDANPDDGESLAAYRAARDAWVEIVIRDVLGWGSRYVTETGIAGADGALEHEGRVGAVVRVIDPVASLRDVLDDGSATSPLDRMEAILRDPSSGVDAGIGVVTDGRWWAIVSAREVTMLASGIVDAQTWIDEAPTRNAFVALLQPQRLVGGKPSDRLSELFGESVAAAEEITEALGVQVRKAVELLVAAFSEAGLEAVRRGQPDPLPADRGQVYDAAVTVMMRVVFLLFAEERGLLPQSRLFSMGYGISDRLDALDQRSRDEGAEALDATFLTWHRLLATSQALYRGASFEDMRLPAYGGSLFDPARLPFLTARSERGTLAVTVSDRVMLAVLRSVQITNVGSAEARRISFRDVDVEQIGYIYEGLLGYTATDVAEVTVGLLGSDGQEPEIPLAQLREFEELDDALIAAAIRDWVATDQPAAKPSTQAALTKALRAGDQIEDAERALLTIAGAGPALREELRGWVGVIRRDLRGRPVVVMPGGLVVTETPSRATSGAHYTPRSLAEEVVEHALKPHLYSPGPHQTADESQWQPVSSDQILALKVADIACGSGAFLVAAARYLAKFLLQAWHREGAASGSTRELEIHAVRQVVATCLYGADINAMAVEMCKLSLWLVSLDPGLPFSFVDDKVLHGNSLIGLTDVAQLERQHIYPDAAPTADSLFDTDVKGVLDRAAGLRRALATEVDNTEPQRSAHTKQRQWRAYQKLIAQQVHIADGVVAAGLRLGGKRGKALKESYENLRIAISRAYPSLGQSPAPDMLDSIVDEGLTPAVPTDYERWQPLHWVLAVADVLAAGGFDAVIGNPPFLGGQKLTGAMGTNVRDWFVNVLADETRGSADLVAYFFLRAAALLQPDGTVGLIATNTVAQGDTRQVGLDRMVADGFTITRAIQSRSWPARSANLEYAAVWGTTGPVADAAARVSDEAPVARISTLLEPGGRTEGVPMRLVANLGLAFQGCIVLGMGFVLEPLEATEWLQNDARNTEVLFPYLNGDDLNSRPDSSASRWVIDFNDRPEAAAQRHKEAYGRVQAVVRPERQRVKMASRRENWWKFGSRAPALRRAIKDLDEVLAITRVSKSVMPMRVPTGQVFSDSLVVFATDSFAEQAVLSSSAHQMWAIQNGSGMRNDPRYTPSDVFETFPRPGSTVDLERIGEVLDTERREIMLRRELGLTKLYNLVNDPDIEDSADPDVARLREIHVDLDTAVMDAYGWGDIDLGHGFHTYRQMERWTVSPAARVEILDRLLELNHLRAAEQGDTPPSSSDEEGDLT
jgi:methylase of polypeptide subunit release factors